MISFNLPISSSPTSNHLQQQQHQHQHQSHQYQKQQQPIQKQQHRQQQQQPTKQKQLSIQTALLTAAKQVDDNNKKAIINANYTVIIKASDNITSNGLSKVYEINARSTYTITKLHDGLVKKGHLKPNVNANYTHINSTLADRRVALDITIQSLSACSATSEIVLYVDSINEPTTIITNETDFNTNTIHNNAINNYNSQLTQFSGILKPNPYSTQNITQQSSAAVASYANNHFSNSNKNIAIGIKPNSATQMSFEPLQYINEFAGYDDSHDNKRQKLDVSKEKDKIRSDDKGTRTLGTWFFDKKSRKRRYISLTGEDFIGGQAVDMARRDKMCSAHPSRSAKAELTYLMKRFTSFFETIPSSEILPSLSSLASWGIPNKTVSRYSTDAKLTTLFDWQIQCLTIDNGKPLRGGNLVYSAPTSGGKTLVAEILMLRKIGLLKEKGGTILFVVPFVSLAEEKGRYFRNLWSDMHIGLRIYHGEEDKGVNAKCLTPDIDVAVCTIERANIIVNQLLEEGKFEQLKMVVIDEVHMLSDPKRGFLLELLLCKILYISKSREIDTNIEQDEDIVNENVQVVAMSATLPNISDLSSWLNASLYVTEFRPTSLSVKVCLDKRLYKIQDTADRSNTVNINTPWMNIISDPNANANGYNIETVRDVIDLDEDKEGVLALIMETVVINKSVMLFCPTKNRCETLCESIAKRIKEYESSSFPPSLLALKQGIDKVNTHAIAIGRQSIVDELKHTAVGVCPKLKETIKFGVAYHHAGLTSVERQILETGFKKGFISVLCATTTLAAGVNLPAHRVIIREPIVGNVELSISSFRQMAGRAGRMGMDAEGEAILMISGKQRPLAFKLLTAPSDKMLSKLHEGEGGGIEKLLLELICCRRLKHENEVPEFIGCTLMSQQHPPVAVKKWTDDALQFLRSKHLVMLLADKGSLQASQFGIATTLSGLSPKDALCVIEPLRRARTKLILCTGLHMVYLVTPPSTCIEPDWTQYYDTIMSICKIEGAELVIKEIGVDDEIIKELAMYKSGVKQVPKFRDDSSAKVIMLRRLYSAIILFKLVQEYPLGQIVNELLNVKRGDLQALQKEASIFCGMTITFCQKLNWDLLGSALESLAGRLGHGIQEELIPLVRIGTDMSGPRARVFFRAGYRSPIDIARADPAAIHKIILNLMPFDGNAPLKKGGIDDEEVINIKYMNKYHHN